MRGSKERRGDETSKSESRFDSRNFESLEPVSYPRALEHLDPVSENRNLKPEKQNALQGQRSLVIGITGGIACGKTEVGRVLASDGVAVCDADDVARRQLTPGHPVFERVVARFGREILDGSGRVDRARLAKRVFASEDERAALNAITHPPVMEEIGEWIALARARGRAAAVIVPLLFEVGAEKHFDAVICVAADERIALERLRARGLTDEQSRRRMAAQWPLAEKVRRADFVIVNDGDLASLRERTREAYQEILRKERSEYV
jgi:dephospho-CoA kinase